MGAWIALMLLVVAGLAAAAARRRGLDCWLRSFRFRHHGRRRRAADLHRLVARRQLSRPGRAGRARRADLGAGGVCCWSAATASATRSSASAIASSASCCRPGRRCAARRRSKASAPCASGAGPTAISWSRPRPTASSLSMLVDTGASTVVLKPADAQRWASTSSGCATRCRCRPPTARPTRPACACAT